MMIKQKKNMNYHQLREWLSEQEHVQWEYWSKAIAKELEKLKEIVSNEEIDNALHLIDFRLHRWRQNWKPYKKLPEDIKDYDRDWADVILNNLPFKCPMYQCGGIMVAKERPYPKGMNEDDFPDGMPGDSQMPDLVCTNCKAVYQFMRFKK